MLTPFPNWKKIIDFITLHVAGRGRPKAWRHKMFHIFTIKNLIWFLKLYIPVLFSYITAQQAFCVYFTRKAQAHWSIFPA